MTRTTQAQWDAKRAEVKARAAEVVKANAEEAKAKLAQLRKEQREVTEAFDETLTEATEPGYAEWTNAELKAELESRELPHSGNKDELIARLTEDDESTEDESDTE